MRTVEKSDHETLQKWCSMRDMPPLNEELIPDTGFIVDDVAAGFLICMNNNMGMIDFYISNPYSDKKERDKVLDEITLELILTAKDVGMKQLICTTQNEAIKKRAMFHGFQFEGEFSAFKMEL
jgi:hypothetical protein